MRVLHVINRLAGGGAENLLLQLLPKLKSRGIDVELLLLTGLEGERSRLLTKAGIKVHHPGRKWLYSPLQISSVLARLKDFDLVHAHLFPSLLWVAIAKKLARAPKAVYTEHSTHNRRRKNPLFRFVDHLAYGQYERIVCISDGVRASLASYLRARHLVFEVIYNGIDLPKFTRGVDGGQKHNLDGIPSSDQGQILICVANLLNGKGQEVLLRAMQRLPADAHAVFVGQGPLERPLRQLACKLGVQARTHFLGFINDVQRVYEVGKICVIPSLWEGFSIVAVEAMANGVPVVASRIPGLSEVVGDAGLYFEPGDSMDLAEKICRLLELPTVLEEHRRKGLQRALEFSIERTADRHYHLYSTLFPSSG